jgi:hypothetical protein
MARKKVVRRNRCAYQKALKPTIFCSSLGSLQRKLGSRKRLPIGLEAVSKLLQIASILHGLGG